MDITYDYYRVFYYVAKYKSFSKAADVLHGSQPNISRFVTNLEKQLGCTLLVRSNRGVNLTPEGERLFNHVSIAYDRLKIAETEILNSKTMHNGTLTIGVSTIALHGVVIDVLKKYRETYPDVRIKLSTYTTNNAIKGLKNGVIDLCVVSTPYFIEKPIVVTPILEVQDLLLASPERKHLAQKPIPLSELNKHTLIALEQGTSVRDFYTQLFFKNGLEFKPDMEVASNDQLLPLIKADFGIGFVCDIFARDALEHGELILLETEIPIPRRNITLVEDSTKYLNIAASTFKKMLINFSKEKSAR